MGVGRVHLQVYPLFFHRVHASQYFHSVGNVCGSICGDRPRQEILADPREDACHARSGVDLGTVLGYGGSRGAPPEHRGEGRQQHILLGGLAGPATESLRYVHLCLRLPAASHFDICLLCQGGCA